MTELHDHPPLSRVELMVLARLSDPKPPTKTDIAKALTQSGVSLTEPELTDCVIATLAALRSRAMVAEVLAAAGPHKHGPAKPPGKASKPKAAAPQFALTDAGRLALRRAFGLASTPTWNDTRDSIVPALALGIAPHSEPAGTALASTDAMIATLLRRDPALGEPTTVSQLCDRLIARALGMPPGPVNEVSIRAYALAVHCGVANKSEFTEIAAKFAPVRGKRSPKPENQLKALATQQARKQLQTEFKDKKSLVKALQRHWLTQQDEADDARWPSSGWRGPLRPSQPADLSPRPPTVVTSPAGDPLLTAVREAMPRIGSDGRYGKENVFVSALWQHLARDWRLSDLSLERFKRWLVAANRDQLLDLARADLVDAMDATLVEESEIEDLGATFHFVIDRQGTSSAPGQAHHDR